MGKQEEKRDQIIAAEAARQAITDANAPPKKLRTNWAASPSAAPPKRQNFRRNPSGESK